MKIELTANGTPYTIEVNTSYCMITRTGVNKDEKSPNLGKPTYVDLGVYPTTVARAIKCIIKDQASIGDDILTLQQYVTRMENMHKELMDQMEGYGL